MRLLTLLLFVVLSAVSVSQVQLPQGRGIWFMDLDATGSPERVARGVKDAQYNYVLILGHQGLKIRNDSSLPRYAQAFKQEGVTVYVWGYNHASTKDHGQAEAKIVNDLLSKPYVDGYVFNGEDHVKVTGLKPRTTNDAVIQLVEEVVAYRNNYAPRKPLGWSTHGDRKALHINDLPVEAFLSRVDFFAPQIYWADFGWDVERSVESCIDNWCQAWPAMGKTMPIVLTGQAYRSPQGRMPTAEEIRQFASAAKRLKDERGLNVAAIDLYRYPQGSRDRDAMTSFDAGLASMNGVWAGVFPGDASVEPVTAFIGTIWGWLNSAYWQGFFLVLMIGLILLFVVCHDSIMKRGPMESLKRGAYLLVVPVGVAFAWSALMILLLMMMAVFLLAGSIMAIRSYAEKRFQHFRQQS